MRVQFSNEIFRPIVHAPSHNYDQYKTNAVIEAEQKANLYNHQVKKVVQQSIHEVYKEFQKLVENTDYNVSYVLNDVGAAKQYTISMKNTGEVVANMPPDLAIAIANKAKQNQTKLGLVLDVSA